MVCRDSNGSIVAAESHEECPGDPLWAESKAALLAASLARKEGFDRVMLEGDAQSVIKSYTKPIHISPLVHQCYNRGYPVDSKLFCMLECLLCF